MNASALMYAFLLFTIIKERTRSTNYLEVNGFEAIALVWPCRRTIIDDKRANKSGYIHAKGP